MTQAPGRMGMSVIGAGYWGPNLVRNISNSAACDLRWVCDFDVARAQSAVGRYSTIRVTDDIDEILGDRAVHAVAIATPAHTHVEVALACLEAGKHVLVEKPLGATVAEGEKLVQAAEDLGLVLMCDHTYCYTPAVQEIRRLVSEGMVGEIHYVDSVRTNLGLLQSDIDVFWDLAPHDLAILDTFLPERSRPVAVSALGADPLGTGFACVGYLTLHLEGGGLAHSHVNWLSPTKVRTVTIGGSERMVVWDDLNLTQRLSLYDKGVDVLDSDASVSSQVRRERKVSYRYGDLSAPALPVTEALNGVIAEFVASIREGRAPLTDGRAGLRVLRILEATSASLNQNGAVIPLGDR
jgi:predicted dehydrogenase